MPSEYDHRKDPTKCPGCGAIAIPSLINFEDGGQDDAKHFQARFGVTLPIGGSMEFLVLPAEGGEAHAA